MKPDKKCVKLPIQKKERKKGKRKTLPAENRLIGMEYVI